MWTTRYIWQSVGERSVLLLQVVSPQNFQLWWSFTNWTTPNSSEKLLMFGLEFGNRTDVFCVQKMSCCHFSLVWVGKFANSFPNINMWFFVAKISWRDVWKLSPIISVKSLNSQEAWLDFKLGGGFKYCYFAPTWGNDSLWHFDQHFLNGVKPPTS